MDGTLRAIRLNATAATLDLEWSDGERSALTYRLLRESCMCADCRRGRQTHAAIAGDGVKVMDAVPFGANAVQLVFSDGHARGIFPFSYLLTLAAGTHVTT